VSRRWARSRRGPEVVGDHVGDGHAGQARDPVREVVLQPLRAAARQRADDRLVVASGIEALRDRVERVRVADHAVSVQTGSAHPGERLVELRAHRLAPAEPGTLRGHDQRDLDRAPLGAVLQRFEQMLRTGGLTGDDEHVRGHDVDRTPAAA